MIQLIRFSTPLFLGLTIATAAYAAPKVNDAAPDFALAGADGKTYKLADLKGKYVVLEWLNHDCPYVKKHYGSGNMQKTQKELTKDGVVWLSVVSSAEGKQGALTAAEAIKVSKEKQSAATAVLLDTAGTVGRSYDAQTTPHMYLIDPNGKLVYMGAIDDKPTTDADDVKTAKNYVLASYQEAKAGKPISSPATKAYGCSVKY